MAAAGAASATEAEHGMVVTAQREASAVGRQVLEAGGNAVDAAVAIGYALAVVDPCCGNIGGGGFMLIHLAGGRDTVIDFRETAPEAATPTMYRDATGQPEREASRYGYRAVAVPGTVMGLDRALALYGTLSRSAAMAPAIALAHDGFVLGDSGAEAIAAKADRLVRDPGATHIFLRPDGSPYRAGDRLVQPDLAATLTAIAEGGADAFYRGPAATAVVAASAAHGGILTEADFAAYKAVERTPLACTYRGYRIVSAPLPSSGGLVLCEMLNILAGWDMGRYGAGSPVAIQLTAEAMRHAYLDRNTWLGDPDFVASPVRWLLSPEHAAGLRAAIEPGRAGVSAALVPGIAPHEKPETTHYSVVDRAGNAVAVTYTINGNFGAMVVAPGTGFLLNNEMDDFAANPGAPNLFGLVQGEANAIRPGKRPLSSMTPTIVFKDGAPVLVLGSPGGPRITTAVLETLMNILDYRMPPGEAVAAARFHHQHLPDLLFYERGGFPAPTLSALTGMGYHLAERPAWGAVELIAIDPGPPRHLVGISDPRRPEGAADGY